MDFFQFLNNSTGTPSSTLPKGSVTDDSRKRAVRSHKEQQTFAQQATSNKKSTQRGDQKDKKGHKEENKAYLRIGQKIRVIYKPNSTLNFYKGYIGEIKYYKSPNEYALVILWAMNSLNTIRMPIDHFMICDD